jgi:hypothetical protein
VAAQGVENVGLGYFLRFSHFISFIFARCFSHAEKRRVNTQCSRYLIRARVLHMYLSFLTLFIRLFQVTGVVGRAETLSSVFFLSALLFYSDASKRRKSTSKSEQCEKKKKKILKKSVKLLYNRKET